jgi:hypothetical protein
MIHIRHLLKSTVACPLMRTVAMAQPLRFTRRDSGGNILGQCEVLDRYFAIAIEFDPDAFRLVAGSCVARHSETLQPNR